MGLIRRHPTACALMVLVLLALLAAHDGWSWWRAARINDTITSGGVVDGDAAAAVPELRFAAAWQQAASGAADAALQRYGTLQGEGALGQAARFNSANLLLRQAALLRAGPQPGQALALVELAKEHYREILREDPAQADARYNLDRAQRLVADPDEADDTPLEGRRNAERAATTMRGHSPGLP
jgi:mxaK protein